MSCRSCQAPSSSVSRVTSASSASSSAPSATPNVSAPGAAVVAAGVMSLGAARGRRSAKKSVVSLRARGGEEDTRVCIPLEETSLSWDSTGNPGIQLSKMSLRNIFGGDNQPPESPSAQELRNTDVEKVGGKSASLGEMISQLSDVGVPVPGLSAVKGLDLIYLMDLEGNQPITIRKSRPKKQEILEIYIVTKDKWLKHT